MSEPDPLAERLARWLELREQGQSVSLDELCADCPELREELRDKLAELQSMQRFIDGSSSGDTANDEPPAAPERPVLPGYEVLEELGCGGMGVVYRARQLRPRRLVALKLILAGGAASRLARFRAEADAVARLQHPNIVQLYEVGEHQGQPYLVLELAEGGSLDRELAGTPVPPRQAAAQVETLARAVHHAHHHGVIHRDLKPANVLLAADGTLKITDFGVAKLLEQDGPTRTEAVVGTPSYMAPEQAGGHSKQVGPAADVYALGAILYELLTGRPPFRGTSSLETLLQVQSEEPLRPGRLQPGVPRELETICLKCLQKEPARRYAAAEELAEDLRRFLAGEPIRARPVGPLGRLHRWARRKPALATLTAALLLVAIVAFALVTWQWREATANARAEAAARRQAERNLYFHTIALAQREWQANHVRRAEELLDGCPGDLRQWEWHYLKRLCHGELLACRGGTAPVVGGAFSPDGRLLACLTADQTIDIRDATTGRVVRSLRRPASARAGAAPWAHPLD